MNRRARMFLIVFAMALMGVQEQAQSAAVAAEWKPVEDAMGRHGQSQPDAP